MCAFSRFLVGGRGKGGGWRGGGVGATMIWGGGGETTPRVAGRAGEREGRAAREGWRGGQVAGEGRGGGQCEGESVECGWRGVGEAACEGKWRAQRRCGAVGCGVSTGHGGVDGSYGPGSSSKVSGRLVAAVV